MPREETPRPKLPYTPPLLEEFGSLLDLTQAVRSGPSYDGGTPPFHKTGKKSK